MIEVLKQALDAFHQIFESTPVYHNDGTCIINDKSVELSNKAIASLRQAIAKLESQERNFCPRCGKRTNDIHTCTPPRNIEQEGKQMIDWYSVEGETRSYGVGMVACVYAIGRDEVVHVVTHESVKDIAMQHLPIQRTWVGLTNDDLTNLLYDTNLGQQSAVLQAIALLKEKNT